MKRFYICSCLCLFSLFAFAQEAVLDSLMHDGLLRYYYVYAPSSYDGETALPLVMNFHGRGSNASQQRLYTGMNDVAEENNFIVIYPEGTKVFVPGENGEPDEWVTHWNNHFGTGVDDLGFANAMIDKMHEDYNINLRQVYSTGMSNGGYMSYMLACELSERIAAIASVTGAMTYVQIENCNPNRAMPVMQIHGTNDDVVFFAGSTFHPSITEGVEYWAENNGCTLESIQIPVPDAVPEDNSTAILNIYGSCDDNAEVHYYVCENAAHTWPNGGFDIGPTNYDFNASEIIWDFFKKYQLPEEDTISLGLSQLSQQRVIEMYPNPVEDVLQIEVEEAIMEWVRVCDVQGKVLFEEKVMQDQCYLDVHNWESGLYLFAVWVEGAWQYQKILKE